MWYLLMAKCLCVMYLSAPIITIDNASKGRISLRMSVCVFLTFSCALLIYMHVLYFLNFCLLQSGHVVH